MTCLCVSGGRLGGGGGGCTIPCTHVQMTIKYLLKYDIVQM